MTDSKISGLRAVSILLFSSIASSTFAQSPVSAHVDHAGLKKLGWQLACQMSTFQDRTVFETLEFLHGQNFHHVELCPGQVMSKEKDVRIGAAMSGEDIAALQAKLKEVHLDIVSVGVVEAADLRPAMEFAKKLKAKNVVVRGALPDDAGKWADELGINIAVIGADGPGEKFAQDKRVGVCLDLTGAGSAEVKKRVIELHVGQEDEAAVLSELKVKNFKGIFAVQSGGASGKDLDEKFIQAVNTFSDEVTKLAK